MTKYQLRPDDEPYPCGVKSRPPSVPPASSCSILAFFLSLLLLNTAGFVLARAYAEVRHMLETNLITCLWKYLRRRRDWWTRPAEETQSRPAMTLSETSKGRYLSRVQRVKLRAPELRAHLDTVRLGFIPGGQLRTKRGSSTLTPQLRCAQRLPEARQAFLALTIGHQTQ